MIPNFIKKQISKNQKGFTTVEILMAFAILVVCISGITYVAFGNQSLSVDTQKNSEAIQIAQAAAEDVRQTSLKSFSSVATGACSTQSGYTCQVSVTDITPVLKQVGVKVAWNTDSRNLKVDLNNLVYDTVNPGDDPGNPGNPGYNPPAGGGTPGGAPNSTICPSSLSSLGQQTTNVTFTPGTTLPSGLDIYTSGNMKTAYVSAIPAGHVTTNKDFYAIDVSDINNIVLDETRSLVTGAGGLNALDIANGYAYTASVDPTKQLIIIDITQNPPAVAGSPVSLPGNSSQALSVFYYNKMVYVGTAQDSGPEFFIYDVSNPASPSFIGSYPVNASVNKIKVSGNYAYLSTSDSSRDVVVLNISTANPTLAGTFDSASANGSLSNYLLGSTLYLGNIAGSVKNITSINVNSPSSMAQYGSAVGDAAANVNDMIVANGLAFLVTDSSSLTQRFQVYNVSDPASISSCAVSTFLFNPIVAMDSSDDLIYIAQKTPTPIKIIKPIY